MAIVVILSPLHTYGTQANGSLVPFTCSGVVNSSGAVVTLQEDTTEAVLAQVAADSTPLASGDWAGWYYWTTTVSTWVPTTGLTVLGATSTTTGGAVPVTAITAQLGGATGTTTGGAIALLGSVPAAGGSVTSAGGDVACAGAVPVSGATVTTTGGAIPISERVGVAVDGATVTTSGGAVAVLGSLTVGGGSVTTTGGSVSISYDTTAPSIGTWSVPSTASSTSITGISAGATDAAGVTGWCIKDVASGASAPTATAGECSQTTGISGGALSSSALTATAGGTGARDFYLFVRDAAANVATSSASTCTISAGPLSVSDDFNRANASDLGANWTQLTGTAGRWYVNANSASGSTVATRGDYWSANSFNGNHYSETVSYACAVRMQPAAQGCYYLTGDVIDEGDGYMTAIYYLAKVVAGTPAGLGSWMYDSGGAGETFPGVFRLEANGTTIALKTAPSHGGTYTTRISATDSSLSGGAAGLYSPGPGGSGSAENWYGGDL